MSRPTRPRQTREDRVLADHRRRYDQTHLDAASLRILARQVAQSLTARESQAHPRRESRVLRLFFREQKATNSIRYWRLCTRFTEGEILKAPNMYHKIKEGPCLHLRSDGEIVRRWFKEELTASGRSETFFEEAVADDSQLTMADFSYRETWVDAPWSKRDSKMQLHPPKLEVSRKGEGLKNALNQLVSA